MSRYELDKFLRDMNLDRALARRWREGATDALDHYRLTAEERQALKGWRVRRLYEIGANPLLLLLCSMAVGKSMRGYMSEIRGEERGGSESKSRAGTNRD